jgi:phage I-like protein
LHRAHDNTPRVPLTTEAQSQLLWIAKGECYHSRRMLKRAHVLLNTSGADGFSPPVEFRLFRAGVNTTMKGDFLFDEKAAMSVMADYRQRGARLMLDLEHLSLDTESKSYDPDPRAWFDLDVRNGELWVTAASWLPDGERRLREKLHPYVSPVFDTDAEGRVTNVLNVGMVAMPATHQPHALIAASARRIKLSGDTNSMMSPETTKSALDVVESGDGAAALEILKALLAEAVSGEAPADAPEEAPPDPAVAEMTAVTGAETPQQALSMIKEWKLAAEKAAESAALSALSERKSLVGKLVTLGAETPVTAFVGAEGAKQIAPRLLSEPIDSLRARVTALSAAKKPAVAPTRGTEVQTPFSARDLAGAQRLNITPAEFVARKNAQVRTH